MSCRQQYDLCVFETLHAITFPFKTLLGSNYKTKKCISLIGDEHIYSTNPLEILQSIQNANPIVSLFIQMVDGYDREFGSIGVTKLVNLVHQLSGRIQNLMLQGYSVQEILEKMNVVAEQCQVICDQIRIPYENNSVLIPNNLARQVRDRMGKTWSMEHVIVKKMEGSAKNQRVLDGILLSITPEQVFGIQSAIKKNNNQMGLGNTASTYQASRIVILVPSEDAAVSFKSVRSVLIQFQVQVILVCGEISNQFVDLCIELGILVATGFSKYEAESISDVTGAIAIPYINQVDSYCLGRATMFELLDIGWVTECNCVVYDTQVIDYGNDRDHNYLLHVCSVEKTPYVSVILCSSVSSLLEHQCFQFWQCLNRLRNAEETKFVLPNTLLTLQILASSIMADDSISETLTQCLVDLIVQIHMNNGSSYVQALELSTIPPNLSTSIATDSTDDYLSTKFLVSRARTIICTLMQCHCTLVNINLAV